MIGILDLAANAAYASSTTRGTLSLVAVLASLYPAVTVLLARQLHAERLTRYRPAAQQQPYSVPFSLPPEARGEAHLAHSGK